MVEIDSHIVRGSIIVLIAIVMLFILPLCIGSSLASSCHCYGLVYWEVVFLPLIILWVVLGGIAYIIWN